MKGCVRVKDIMFYLFAAIMFVTAISNFSVERKIRKLNKRVTNFEKEFYNGFGADIKSPEGVNEYYLLETLPTRLEQIEFCYQCPLYQSKVQGGKRQTFQENK